MPINDANRRTFLRSIGAGSIGTLGLAGLSGTAAATTAIVIEGGGWDIWADEDAFHYYYTQHSGDFDVTVNVLDVEDTDPWAKGGIMVRESLEADAANVMARHVPAGETSLQWRPEAGAESDSSDAIDADWMRLRRDGDVLTLFGSTDGDDWTEIASVTGDDVDVGADVYLGLAVTSHDEGTRCTARFTNLSGVAPTANRDVGVVDVAGSVSVWQDVPIVATGEPAGVTATSASLSGRVEALADAEAVDVHFEYRSTDADEWNATPVQTLSSAASFDHDLSSLSPQRTYEFRAVGRASDGDGDAYVGSIRSFTTPDVVQIEPVTDVGPTSATFNGRLDGVEAAGTADVRFEYREVPTADWIQTDGQSLAVDADDETFSTEVTALASRRYYDVRARLETDDLEATSSIEAFSTPGRSNGDPPDHAGPSSRSQFDPEDGFADPAPWLDDDTPVIKVREPTRAELERALTVDGERLVVFETSGTIDLGGEEDYLRVESDNLYLAGQTAPSPGITLVRGGLYISAEDCVIQHIRAYAGDAGNESEWSPDAIRTRGRNHVVDHCTALWGIEQTLTISNESEETTFSNNLIAEGLHDSIHRKGIRSYGTLVGDDSDTITLVGNVWAHNRDRNPRLKLGTDSVVANNVVYHYDDGIWMDDGATASIEGNAFLRPTTDVPNVFDGGEAYVDDNYTDGDVAMVGDGVTELEERPLWPAGLELIPSEEVLEHNLANAGARPADRTAHDERVLNLVANREGEWIDSQEEVGGYPDLDVNTHALNVPQSATRAWLRRWSRRVELPADD